MKRRLFVGISIEHIGKFIVDFQLSYADFPVHWLKKHNLHVTLVPPWYEEDVASVIERLKQVRVAGFEMQFDRVTFGPDARKPRLIWAEGEATQGLLDLKDDIEKVLGITREKRDFRPHITLARFRAEEFRNFPVKVLDESVNWCESVSSFVLYESHLSPRGAEYEIVEKFVF